MDVFQKDIVPPFHFNFQVSLQVVQQLAVIFDLLRLGERGWYFKKDFLHVELFMII